MSDIDFASLMNQFNEVTVPLWPDINPLETDDNNNDDDLNNDSDAGSSSSEELMLQLVSLTQKQKDEAHIVQSTSTSTTSISTNSYGLEENTSDLRTVDSGIQADEFFTEEGTMTAQPTTSIGVSASLGDSSQDFVDQNRENSRERGTIFLDLRNQKIEPKKSTKVTCIILLLLLILIRIFIILIM